MNKFMIKYVVFYLTFILNLKILNTQPQNKLESFVNKLNIKNCKDNK